MPSDNPSQPAIPQNIMPSWDDIAKAKATVIPLYLIPITSGSNPEYKVGIRIAVDNVYAVAGGNWYFYEFDTGGKGFYANAKCVNNWLGAKITNLGSIYTQYHSGITYVGTAAAVSLRFESMTESGVGAPFHGTGEGKVTIGLIDQLYELSNGVETSSNFPIYPVAMPNGEHNTPTPDFGFQGDFGMSLQQSDVNQPLTFPLPANAPALAQQSVTLWSVMPMLKVPVGVLNFQPIQNFIIDLVNLQAVADFDSTISKLVPPGTMVGRLIVSPQPVHANDPTLTSNFTLTSPLHQIDPPFGYVDPNSFTVPAYTTYAAGQQTGSLTVEATTSGATPQTLNGLPFVMDTGAPETTIYQPSSGTRITPPTAPYTVLIETNGSTPIQLLSYTVAAANNAPGKTATNWRSAPSSLGSYINTGIAPYLSYPIMFDLNAGLMRFAQAS